MEVGFINEPVFVGDKSGLEFFVHKGDTPVDGSRDDPEGPGHLPGPEPRPADHGARGRPRRLRVPVHPDRRRPVHVPPHRDDRGQAIDEPFTSSPTGFDEVKEQASGQFPVQFPSQADVVADAQAGRNAANQVTIALVLGAAGLLFGLSASVSRLGRAGPR